MKIELDDKQADFLMRALINNFASLEEDFEKDDYIGTCGIAGLLIGKLVQADPKLRLRFCEIKDDMWKKDTSKTQYLFMGAGYHSSIMLNKLHKKIQYAAGILGGMQQNGGMGSTFSEDSDKQDKQSLKEIVLDILTAFGLTVDDLK